MVSLAEYFEQNRYKPKWHIGDRVYGTWNKIMFVGTVGNDTLINETEGPRVSVFLDLPLKYKDTIHNILFVKPNTLKQLKEIDDGTSSEKRVAPSRKKVRN
jgi:hypothetical protein